MPSAAATSPADVVIAAEVVADARQRGGCGDVGEVGAGERGGSCRRRRGPRHRAGADCGAGGAREAGDHDAEEARRRIPSPRRRTPCVRTHHASRYRWSRGGTNACRRRLLRRLSAGGRLRCGLLGGSLSGGWSSWPWSSWRALVATAFFATAFFAGAFLAAGRLTGAAFLATVFLTGGLLGDGLLRGGLLRRALAREDRVLERLQRSHTPRREALMRMASPVCGLRPILAANRRGRTSRTR